MAGSGAMTKSAKPKCKNKGFTLIELLVVTGIIVLFTALVLANYRLGEKQLGLQRAAHQLAQDLRRSQEMALSSQKINGQVPRGYGVYLNKNQAFQYILFADLDANQRYSGPSEKVEEKTLEGIVRISQLLPELDSALTITFVPPDPSVVFYPDAAAAFITLSVEETKTIQVNKAGLIAIE